MENMKETIFLGDNYWNLLGKVFDTPVSVDEAVNSVCPWDIEKLPVFGLTGEVSHLYIKNTETGEFEDYFMPDFRILEGYQEIKRAGTDVTLKLAPTSYEVVDNKRAFKWLEPVIDAGMLELESGIVLNDGKIILFCCRVPNTFSRHEFADNDNIELKFYLATSHDGTIPISVGKLAYKLEGYSQIANVVKGKVQREDVLSFRHTLNIEDKLESAKAFITKSIHEFNGDTVSCYGLLRDIPCTQELFESYCSKVLSTELRGREVVKYKSWSKINNIYNNSPYLKDIPFSVYRAYMALSEYWSQHAGGIELENCVTRFKSNLVGLNKTKNHKALEIALTYLM
jgi:hypothetical protein